jgi:hypothetical protein
MTPLLPSPLRRSLCGFGRGLDSLPITIHAPSAALNEWSRSESEDTTGRSVEPGCFADSSTCHWLLAP